MSSSPRLPAIAQVYIAVVVLGAAALIFAYAMSAPTGWPLSTVPTAELIIALVVFSVGGFLTEQYPISLPNTRIFDANAGKATVSSAVYLASLLLYGPAFTLVVALVSIVPSELLQRKAFAKVAFNVGQYVLTVGVSGMFLLITGTNPHSFVPLVGSVTSLLVLAGTLAAYFLMNTGLVSGVLACVTGASFTDMWVQNIRDVVRQYAAMLNVGIVAAMLWTVSPFAVVLLALPMLVLQFAFRLTDQLKHETLRALIGIAEMVDARDSYAYRHSMEVARYANLIATKLGLPLEDVEMINVAGMLHDIGKIGTPDRVLHKPGALVGEERDVMELHPSEGAKVLQYFALFRPGADLVLYHQEHFDGTGYPQGLAGGQIPLGARIIHVADAYQAMTSDRVYRKALPVEEAVRRLQASAGTHFDPVIVDAMLDVLRDQGLLAGGHQDADDSSRLTDAVRDDDARPSAATAAGVELQALTPDRA